MLTKLKETNQPLLYLSGTFGFLFLIVSFAFPALFREKLGAWTEFTLGYFGQYYLYFGFLVIMMMLVLAVSKTGKVRLGNSDPEYKWFSWVAMLYSTGMGAGLMLRAVQEPVYFLINPPSQVSHSNIIYALQYTFFHWGFTPWAFYGLFGLIIAYNLYIHKRTILGSAILEPRFQKTKYKLPIDTLILISTLFGVVAAVGLGSRQLSGGLGILFDQLELNVNHTLAIVIVICSIATFSAYLGVTKGIRNLSNFNIGLALLLMLFVLLISDFYETFFNFFLAFGNYLRYLVSMSLNLGNQEVSKTFLTEWTYFYWAFWLAWAPFTGVFIARISKGRTIREFILATLIIPAMGTFLWFSVFGSHAFGLIGETDAYQGQFDSIYQSLFVFFSQLPFGGWLNVMSLILIFTFLITSVDSAIFVLGMFSDQGNEEPGRNYRLFWGFTLTLFTLSVVFIGQDVLLEAVSQLLILIALPFSFLFLGMMGFFMFKLYQNPLKT